VLLNGEPEEKLQAAHNAGFDQVEIWREDVEACDGGATALARIAAQQGPGFTNLQAPFNNTRLRNVGLRLISLLLNRPE
jgi:sugar phosphate isomerase/epimerase